MLSIWTSLKIYLLVKVKLQQKLEPDQVGSTCRQQNKSVNDEVFLQWSEKIVRKGENAGYQHIFPFPQCFPKA